MMTNNKRKSKGQVYTPDYLVRNMLDWAGYNGSGILRRHAMDNSCGDGAFICQMSDRYCREFLKTSSNRERLRHELETYIHGIEIIPAVVSERETDRGISVGFLYSLEFLPAYPSVLVTETSVKGTDERRWQQRQEPFYDSALTSFIWQSVIHSRICVV